nr:PREDICTED: uncharacterized protein LOC104152765 [Struthio camelus australis]
MASVLSRRLGKRSLLGTRVSAPSSLADGVLVTTQLPGLPADLSRVSSHAAPREDGPCKERAEESSRASRFPSPNRPQLHAGQQCSFSHLRWSRVLPWSQNTARLRSVHPVLTSSCNARRLSRKRSLHQVRGFREELQEEEGGMLRWEARLKTRFRCGVRSCSERWDFAVQKPPCIWADPSDVGRILQPNAAAWMERLLRPQLRGQPASGRRCRAPRRSERVLEALRVLVPATTSPCSWLRLAEVLAQSLSASSPSWLEEAVAGPAAGLRQLCGDGDSTATAWLAGHGGHQALCAVLAMTSATSPGLTLNRFSPIVPQALPSIQIPVSPHIFTSISWATATSTLPSLSPVRSRSLSFSEPQPATPMLKSHLIVASPPRMSLGTRKVRGEAKKCRKVYGIEHRDQWCTACRWKKACQRFLD